MADTRYGLCYLHFSIDYVTAGWHVNKFLGSPQWVNALLRRETRDTPVYLDVNLLVNALIIVSHTGTRGI